MGRVADEKGKRLGFKKDISSMALWQNSMARQAVLF